MTMNSFEQALEEYLTTPGWGQPVSKEEMTDNE